MSCILGDDTTYGSLLASSADRIFFHGYVATCRMVALEISTRGAFGDGDIGTSRFRLGIYDSPVSVPVNLLSATDAYLSDAGTKWRTLPLLTRVQIIPGKKYWLAIHTEYNGGVDRYAKNAGSPNGQPVRYQNRDFDLGLPSPASSVSGGTDDNQSFYAMGFTTSPFAAGHGA